MQKVFYKAQIEGLVNVKYSASDPGVFQGLDPDPVGLHPNLPRCLDLSILSITLTFMKLLF